MVLGKPYYWNTNTAREKTVFLNSTIRIYKKYTGGKAPGLVGFDSAMSSPVATSPTTSFPTSPGAYNTSYQDAHTIAPAIPQSPTRPVISGRRPSIGNVGQRTISLQRPTGPTSLPSQTSMGQPPLVPNNPPSVPQVAPVFRTEESFSRPAQHADRSVAPLAPLAPIAPIVPLVSAAPIVSLASQTPSVPSTSVDLSKTNAPPPLPPQAITRAPSLPYKQESPVPDQGPLQPEIPTIILNSDPNQRPPSFAPAARNSAGMKNGNDHVIAPSIQVSVPESPKKEHEESLRDLADGVIYDSSNKRSSIQGIKVFARKEREEIDDKPKSKSVSIRYEVQQEDGTVTQLNDEDNYESDGGKSVSDDEDSSGATEDKQDTASLSSRGMSFMAPSNAYIVEETLEELNWTGRTDVKTLEMSIANEISALEAQNLHNVVDLDDKLDDLNGSLADAIKECEKLDTVLAFFSVQLGSFGDEIAHIEGQGEGLQVQTRNQKVLWTELNNILHTVSLPNEALAALGTHGFSKIGDIAIVEKVLIDLYNAVKAVKSSGNDGGGEFLGSMRALKEKRHIYEQAAAEFMSKYKAFLDKQIAAAVAKAENTIVQTQQSNEPKLITLENIVFQDLYPTSSITLFVKEIDDLNYFSLLRGYQQKIKPYYDEASAAYFIKWKRTIGQQEKGISDLFVSKEVSEVSISSQMKTSLKRSGTLAKLRPHTEPKDRGDRHGSAAGLANSNAASAENALIANIAKSSPVSGYLVKCMGVIKSLLICQQELLVVIFHVSSFAVSKYPEYVKASPVTLRMKEHGELYERVFDIDSDRGKAQDLLNAMNEIFSPLQDHMVKFVSEVLEQNSTSCPGLLTAIEVLRKGLEVTNQDYLNQLLARLYDKVVQVWNQFISKQLANIGSTMISSKRRTGAVFFIRVFPAFCRKIEQDIKQEMNPEMDINDMSVRAVVDKSYDQIGKTMIHTLQRTAKESHGVGQQRPGSTTVRGEGSGDTVNDYEDKELLNYHIFMIENMSLMSEGLEPFERNNTVLHNLCRLSYASFRTEIDLYVEFLMHRPVGKFRAFVDDVEQVFKKNPNDNPAAKPGLSRSALKKLLIGYDVKELRKGLDNLRRRVEKHFIEVEEGVVSRSDPAFQKRLVSKIWKFTEAQYATLFNKLTLICQRHYSGAGDSGYVCAVEFTEADITQAFNSFNT